LRNKGLKEIIKEKERRSCQEWIAETPSKIVVIEHLHEKIVDIGREVWMGSINEISIEGGVYQFPCSALFDDVAYFGVEAVFIADDHVFPAIDLPGQRNKGRDAHPKDRGCFFSVFKKIDAGKNKERKENKVGLAFPVHGV